MSAAVSSEARALTWPALFRTFLLTRLVCLAGLTLGGHRASGGGNLTQSLLAGVWHWDVHWYFGIAVQGYSFTHGAGSNVAYFPAAPFLMSWVGRVIGHPIAAGILLSVVESAAAVTLVVRIMRPLVGDLAAERGAMLLLLWPTSVFLVLPYADALLLLAAVATFTLALSGRTVLAGLAGAVGALTRSTGIFLAVPLALIVRERRGKYDHHAWIAALVALGTAVYAVGLFVRFGEPLGFASAEAAGWHRVALPPPLSLAYTAGRLLLGFLFVAKGRPDIPLSDFLDLLSVAMVGWAVWSARRRIPAAYLAWPAVGLIWPLLTGTTSVARYILVLFPAFALVAERLSERQWRRLLPISVVALFVTSYSFGTGGWIG